MTTNLKNQAATLNHQAPYHIQVQQCAQKYINYVLSALHPLKVESHPDNGPVYKGENVYHKTRALVIQDRILSGRIEIDVSKYL